MQRRCLAIPLSATPSTPPTSARPKEFEGTVITSQRVTKRIDNTRQKITEEEEKKTEHLRRFVTVLPLSVHIVTRR